MLLDASINLACDHAHILANGTSSLSAFQISMSSRVFKTCTEFCSRILLERKFLEAEVFVRLSYHTLF